MMDEREVAGPAEEAPPPAERGAAPLLLLIPTAAGIRAVVNGMELYAPRTALQLLDMGARFIEAGMERLRQPDPGSWRVPGAGD